MTAPNHNTQKNGNLRIALLVKNFVTSGGAERYAVEVTRLLADRGFDFDIYTRKIATPLPRGARRILVPDRWRFSGAASLYAFGRDCARLLRSVSSYDVVHSHDRTFSQDIATLHTYSFKSGTGDTLLARLTGQMLSPRVALHLWLEKRQMHSPWLVAVSDDVKKDAFLMYPAGKLEESILPGVDPALFCPEPHQKDADKRMRDTLGIPATALLLLFVGSDFKRKGLDLLIPHLGTGTRLIVVGAGEDTGVYRRLALKHNTAHRIVFVGLVQDLRPYYRMADALVLPSRREAFGMAVLEAMASGLAVVCRRSCGVSSLIRHRENGLLFSSPDELTDLFRELKNTELRQTLGGAGLATAARLSWEHSADMYESLYRKVAASKKKSWQMT